MKYSWIAITLFSGFILNSFITTVERTEEGTGATTILVFGQLLLTLFDWRSISSVAVRGKFVFVCGVYIFASTLWSDNPLLAIKQSILFIMGAFSALHVAVYYPYHARRIFSVFVYVSFALLSISYLLVLFKPEYGIAHEVWWDAPRWKGVTDHPNRLGMLCLFSIWAALSRILLSQSSFDRTLFVLPIILSVIVLLGTDSIASTLVCVAIVTVYAFYLVRISTLRKIFLFSTIFIVALSFVVFSDVFNLDLVTQSLNRESTLTGRTRLWAIGAHAIAMHPILGWGFGGDESLSKYIGGNIPHFHNGYIEVFIRGGLIALILTISLAILFTLRCNKLIGLYKNTFVILSMVSTGVLIHNFAESSFFKGLNPMWLMFLFAYFVGITMHGNKHAIGHSKL